MVPGISGTARSDDGTPIAYVDSGAGETALVLIHGGFVDHRVFRRQMGLAREIRIVAPDLGGHGLSGHARVRWTLEALGADVACVVRELGLKKVVLAGSSLGGPVALEAARQLGEIAAGVIGIDSLHDAEGKPDREAWGKYVAGLREHYEATRDAALKSLFHPDADPAVVDEVRRMALESDARTLGPLLDFFADWDQGAAMRAARVPVRCLNGDLYPTNVEANRKYDPGFQVIVFPRTGHYPMLERTERFNAELLRFARELLAHSTGSSPHHPAQETAAAGCDGSTGAE